MGIVRRRLISGAVAAAVPFTARAQRQSSIAVAALGGVFQQRFQAALIDDFRRVRPEIKVHYYAVSNPAQILGLLRQRLEQAQFDVVLLNPRLARLATREGLLAPLLSDTIPALAELVPASRPDDIAGAIAMVDCLSIPHMPAAARPDMSSWRLLWDASIARRIAIPAAPDPVGIGLTLIASRLFSQGDERQLIAGGIAALTHLAPRVVSWNPRPDVYDLITEEQAAFGVGWNGIGQVYAGRDRTRLRIALPRDFPVRDVHTIGMAANAAQPQAARAFINHVLSAEGQARMAEALFMTPVNPRARISPETAQRLIPLEHPSRPIIGIDAPEIEALRGPIVAGWREQVMRSRRYLAPE